MSIDDLERILGNRNYSEWVYHRLRGHCNEIVEQKRDFSNKIIMSSKNLNQKVNSYESLIEISHLVVLDLKERIQLFFDETDYIPFSLQINYHDHSIDKSKSVIIDIDLTFWINNDISEYLSKIVVRDLKQLKNILPCKSLMILVKKFKPFEQIVDKFNLLQYFSN